jgi:hypothetical protein
VKLAGASGRLGESTSVVGPSLVKAYEIGEAAQCDVISDKLIRNATQDWSAL